MPHVPGGHWKEFCKRGHTLNSSTRDLHNHCIPCRQLIRRKQSRLYRYGVSYEQYNQMLKAQEYKCAICNRHESELKRRLGIDHNHLTGRVRELLCHRCNSMIVMILENYPELVEKTKQYLMKHEPIKEVI